VLLDPLGADASTEVAARAGVDVEYIDRLAKLGILEPAATHTPRRARSSRRSAR
jgi:hypothetical protein